MASQLLACCRALGRTCTPAASCQQLPQIPGLVQPWVASDEPMLKHILSFTLTKAYGARIVADEWEAVPGLSNLGKGDIVAELPCGAHLVIELKHLDTRTPGRTARTRRNRHRSYLEQQACTYGRIWQERLQQQGDTRPVIYASYTNEKGLEYHEKAAAADSASDSTATAVMAVMQALNRAGNISNSSSSKVNGGNSSSSRSSTMLSSYV